MTNIPEEGPVLGILVVNICDKFDLANSMLDEKLPKEMLEAFLEICDIDYDFPIDITMTPDNKAWTDWRDNLRPSLITEEDVDYYEQFKDWLMAIAEADEIWYDEDYTESLTVYIRAELGDEDLMRFTSELWRRVIYHRIQNHILSQHHQLEEDFAEFKHALSMLKANHEDSEEDFVWSEKNRLELRRRV